MQIQRHGEALGPGHVHGIVAARVGGGEGNRPVGAVEHGLLRPGGDAQAQGEGLAVADGYREGDPPVEGVVRLLAEGEGRAILQGEAGLVVAVQARPQSVLVHGVGVLRRLGDGAGQVGRAAVAQDVLAALLAPDQLVGQLFGPAEHVLVEEPPAVQADARQVHVEHHALQHVHVLRRGVHQEHAPRPEHSAQGGAGLVVGGDVGQLVLIAVGLVHQLVLEEVPVGGCAVVQRAAAAGDVHLLGHQVVPHRVQHRAVVRVAFFHVQVGDAGVEVVGAHGVADDLPVLLEGDAVLVVVHAVLHGVPQLNGQPGDAQVFRIPRGAVHLDQPHVVGGAYGGLHLAGTGGGVVEVAEVVGSLLGHVQEAVPAGEAVVQAGGGEHVAHVVHLKVVDVPLPGNTVALPFADDLLGGQVAVGQLGPGEERDVLLQLIQQGLIARAHRGVRGGLHPLVEVAVAKDRPGEFALRLARGNAEVFHHMADVLALEHVLQMRNGHLRAGVEALLVQPARPADVLIGDAIRPGIGGTGGICQHQRSPFSASAFFSATAPKRGEDRVGLP